MSRPRLLVVTPYAYPAERWGGPVPAIHQWCEALAERGWSLRILTTDADVDGHVEVALRKPVMQRGLPYEYDHAWTGLPLFVAPHQIASVPRASKDCDLVWTHGLWTVPGLVAAAVARARGLPYVITPHGSLHPWSLKRNASLKRLLLRTTEGQRLSHAAAVHFTCEQERELAASLHPIPRSLIAPCVVTPPKPEEPMDARAWLGIEAGAPLVLYMSRVHPKKGVDLLIDAFATLPQESHLVIAGPGEPDYLAERRAQARACGVEARVHFPGMVTGPHKQALLQQSRVFCLPSHQENFGIVVPEAMLSGLPVVLSRHVDIWSEVVGADAGIDVDMTPASIADALHRLISDEPEARSMGERGRRYATHAYASAQIGETLDRHFRDLTQTPPQHRAPATRYPTGETCPD
ncbi:MAG: glycosyltransferase [Polyangiaceae bacterium]